MEADLTMTKEEDGRKWIFNVLETTLSTRVLYTIKIVLLKKKKKKNQRVE